VLELRRLPGPIEAAPDMPFEGDHARDQDDHARDQADRDGDHSRIPFERKPGHQYAENYPDPITGHPLQTHPTKAELARAHGVRPGTMGRMLIIRAVRAAAEESERRAA
jgi:hypothetical protein